MAAGRQCDGNGQFISLLKDFREYTTLHGVQYIQRDARYKCRRLYWTVAMVLVLCLLIYYMNKLYIYSTNKSTKINPHFLQTTELPFPAVTICNISPYKTTRDIFVRNQLEHLLHLNEWEYLDKVFFGNTSSRLNDTVKDERKENITFSFSDLFKLCSKDRKVISCSEYVVPKVTQWGLCYTFNSYEHYLSEGTLYVSSTGTQTAVSFYLWIRKEISNGIKMVLHENTEEPDVINNAFILSPAFASYVSITVLKSHRVGQFYWWIKQEYPEKTIRSLPRRPLLEWGKRILIDYKHLPPPYTISGDEYCIDTKESEYVNPLKHYTTYSYSGCLMECRRNFIVEQCGCKGVLDKGNESICTTTQELDCYHRHDPNYKVNRTVYEECYCHQPCEYIKYKYSISSTLAPASNCVPVIQSLYNNNKMSRSEYLEVRLFFDSLSYVFMESVPEYSVIDGIGILGGLMGLFLGASLLTISEILELLIMSVTMVISHCIREIKKDKRNRITTSEEQVY